MSVNLSKETSIWIWNHFLFSRPVHFYFVQGASLPSAVLCHSECSLALWSNARRPLLYWYSEPWWNRNLAHWIEKVGYRRTDAQCGWRTLLCHSHDTKRWRMSSTTRRSDLRVNEPTLTVFNAILCLAWTQ